MKVKRECKEGEDYFLSSGLRYPIRTSVNLPGGLGIAINKRTSYPLFLGIFGLHRDSVLVVGQLL